ncbi:MAG: hypothetical protein HN736_08190 [Anaerolineae bacterium]|jgi:hypothetical protein|nr:hypothetical protein [Anaerolineae bacterium]MBT4131991.1 hypothetical protein [Candidatus Neomarinimicrobiota bacterium]MBT3713846.1 hypothetical protein [Anaerolineae bacterium]MBT4308938.1 hypothetical protein [Anaerolineae bacterium]MBT4457388.1 hypothetical protein [Anaerolineae bacterium]
MSKKTLKYWSFFFLLASLEGGFALFTLLSLPTDPTNNLIFGLSASRLLMVVVLLSISLLSAWLGILSWRKSIWMEKYLATENFPKSFAALTWLSALTVFLIAIALFFLRYYDPEKLLPLFERAKPLALFIIILGFQFSLWLLFLRKGFDTKEFRNKKNFQTAGIIFAIFLALFAFVSISGIGLIPDSAYWAEPGVAIQGWQFALALIIGLFALLFNLKFSFKKKDLFIAILIWGIAAAIWWSVPMDVLKNSFYAPFAYPLGKSLPYSDAGFYDYLSQGLLLGNGFLSQIPPRPLYLVFLAGLRAIVGINDYDQIMLGQTLVLSLFPVVLYFLGKTLHSRTAGITIAFLGIFREWTNLLVSSQTRVSNSRMMLTDLPTALVLSLVALVVIYWFQKRDRQPLPPLIAGGTFGMLLLLRTQSMLILPIIILLALLIFFPRWKNWGMTIVIFMLGVLLSISPWLTRNAQLTGKFTFDDPKQLSVLASQYKKTDNLNLDFDFENESVSNSVIDFALENPVYVANFISTHFIATELNGLLALPLIEPFHGFQEPINIYWTSWNGSLSLANQFLLVFYLAIIALGIGASWRRLGWVGLMPLAFNLGYALSNGVARFSGWRYDLPADWIAYFYFGIGFAEFLILLVSLFGVAEEKIITAQTEKKKEKIVNILNLRSILLPSFLFLSIGFSPIILEENISPHFDSLSEQELIAKIAPASSEIESFAMQENARVLMGRLIYPRFYAKGNGLASAHPWPAYGVQDFSRMGFTLINEKSTQVIFPVKHMPAEFPTGVDAILLGCQNERYLEARLIYLMDNEKILLSEKNMISCNE